MVHATGALEKVALPVMERISLISLPLRMDWRPRILYHFLPEKGSKRVVPFWETSEAGKETTAAPGGRKEVLPWQWQW